MSDLPAHIGRCTDDETGYALICNAVIGEDPFVDPLCGKPAYLHLRWRETDTENSFACTEHVAFARSFHPSDEHRVTGSACGMPDGFWVDGDPSRCVMDVLDEEPALVSRRELAVTP